MAWKKNLINNFYLEVVELLNNGGDLLEGMVRHHDDAGVLVLGVDQQLVEKVVVSGQDQTVGLDDPPALADYLTVRERFLLPEILHVWLLRRGETRLGFFILNKSVATLKVGRDEILVRLGSYPSLTSPGGFISEADFLLVVLVGLQVIFVLRHPVRTEALLPEGRAVDELLRRHGVYAGDHGLAQGTEHHVLQTNKSNLRGSHYYGGNFCSMTLKKIPLTFL